MEKVHGHAAVLLEVSLRIFDTLFPERLAVEVGRAPSIGGREVLEIAAVESQDGRHVSGARTTQGHRTEREVRLCVHWPSVVSDATKQANREATPFFLTRSAWTVRRNAERPARCGTWTRLRHRLCIP
jgi:hypothetical protein